MTRIVVVIAAFIAMPSAFADQVGEIQLRLFVEESTICLRDREVPVEVTLRNVSRSEITIDLNRVGIMADQMALYSTEAKEFRSATFQSIGDSLRPKTRNMRVKAGRSVHTKGAILLDAGLFSEAGFYQVRILYSSAGTRHLATSNWVILQVDVCSQQTPNEK